MTWRTQRHTYVDNKEKHMLNLALTFLIVALIAGVLGLTGIAGISANIAWILFVGGLVLAIIMFVMGRRPPL
ncbi:MAG: DUF1328 domain-containing protein [Haliea sp.]|nr:DUF1328 domain-containing protein [Haliea sp.]MBK6740897.1 DUF1328 domain-containing protein [Haliea sp.]